MSLSRRRGSRKGPKNETANPICRHPRSRSSGHRPCLVLLATTRHRAVASSYYCKANGTGGKPLVVFRIEAERRIQINGFELIRGNKREGWPIETINANQNEFGAFPPTDATVWQMAVFVDMESSDPLNGLKRMAATWKLMRQHGSSFYNAAQMSRKMFYPVESKWVENAPITNTVPVGMQQFFRLSQ